MIASRLDNFLAAERSAVDHALVEILEGVSDADRIIAPIRYAIEGGGKRLRPILCIAAFRTLRPGPVPAAVYRLAAALELIHTYSLIHDDLPAMDDAAVRRGRPATHVAHGMVVAAVAGAAMVPLAVRVARDAAEALGLSEGAIAAAVRTLCIAAGGAGMVGGQLLDLDAEGRTIGLRELERIHRLKTGALLAAAPRLGGLAAGAAPPLMDALEVYGRSLGLAFQIMDDILDVTGSTAVLGKTAGRDSQLEKATFPALAGLDAARDMAENEVAVARAALAAAGLAAPELDALVGYAVERDR